MSTIPSLSFRRGAADEIYALIDFGAIAQIHDLEAS
jgi:hypothetical protein